MPVPIMLETTSAVALTRPNWRSSAPGRALSVEIIYRFKSMVHLSLACIAGQHPAVEVLRMAARQAERFPCVALKMFGQHDDLAGVIGVVRDLPVDGLHHGMRFTSD